MGEPRKIKPLDVVRFNDAELTDTVVMFVEDGQVVGRTLFENAIQEWEIEDGRESICIKIVGHVDVAYGDEEKKYLTLEPCPFCGGKPEFYPDSGDGGFVRCPTCGVLTDTFPELESVSIWNTRAGKQGGEA